MNRALDAAGALVTLLGGGAVASWAYVAETIKTGNPDLDRWALRCRIAWYAVQVFGPRALEHGCAIPKALMAIANNESRGRRPPVVGDASLGGGPSVGPMQVYRSTAKEMGLWEPPAGASEAEERAAYAELAQHEGTCIRMGVHVFKVKLSAAGGDVADAVRRYNGGGSAAADYRDRALAFAGNLGWNLGGAA